MAAALAQGSRECLAQTACTKETRWKSQVEQVCARELRKREKKRAREREREKKRTRQGKDS